MIVGVGVEVQTLLPLVMSKNTLALSLYRARILVSPRLCEVELKIFRSCVEGFSKYGMCVVCYGFSGGSVRSWFKNVKAISAFGLALLFYFFGIGCDILLNKNSLIA